MGVILVVDDEKVVRDICERGLVNHGYTVILAADVPDALVYSSQADVIVTDLHFPGGPNGVDLWDMLAPKGKTLILMTGAQIDPEKHLNRFSAVLLKPFRIDCLLEAVRDSMD